MPAKEAIDRTRVLIADLNRRIETSGRTKDFKEQQDLVGDFVIIHTQDFDKDTSQLLENIEDFKAIIEEHTA